MGKGARLKRERSGDCGIVVSTIRNHGFRMVEEPKDIPWANIVHFFTCDDCGAEVGSEMWKIEWMKMHLKKQICVSCQFRSGLLLGGESYPS